MGDAALVMPISRILFRIFPIPGHPKAYDISGDACLHVTPITPFPLEPLLTVLVLCQSFGLLFACLPKVPEAKAYPESWGSTMPSCKSAYILNF